jgi:hypothetical protein
MRLPFSLTLNTVLLGTLLLWIGSTAAIHYWTYKPDPYQPIQGSALPAPQQVGKSKVYVSKDRDASMYTELARRRTIQTANNASKKPEEVVYWNRDSTNGSLETFFLSSIYL